jgi:hypothetical protein
LKQYVNSKRNLHEGVSTPDEELAAAFHDGGGPQPKAVTTEALMVLDEEILCGTNKHSASRSVGEQPMNLMQIFKCVHHNQKRITSKCRPMIGFKQKVNNIFCELQQDGRINFTSLNSTALGELGLDVGA